jgi:hypothetical protein
MKWRWLFTFFFLSLLQQGAMGQSVKPLPYLYGFSRETIGGASPRVPLAESGTIITKPAAARIQYFIFLEYATGKTPVIQAVWIKGKQYNFKTDKINSPFVLANPNLPHSTGDSLIKATRNPVWQIQLLTTIDSAKKSNGAILANLKSNEVVVQYSLNRKTFLLSVKTAKSITPLALQ